jgi:hypothetical protein
VGAAGSGHGVVDAAAGAGGAGEPNASAGAALIVGYLVGAVLLLVTCRWLPRCKPYSWRAVPFFDARMVFAVEYLTRQDERRVLGGEARVGQLGGLGWVRGGHRGVRK